MNLIELIPGCSNFHWREFLWLPQWKIYVFPDDRQKLNIIEMAQSMEEVRYLMDDRPIKITSGLRPDLYNAKIGGTPYSAHKLGRACDFKVKGVRPNSVRLVLKEHLEELGLRMENLPDSEWVHMDTKKPGPSGRFFTP